MDQSTAERNAEGAAAGPTAQSQTAAAGTAQTSTATPPAATITPNVAATAATAGGATPGNVFFPPAWSLQQQQQPPSFWGTPGTTFGQQATFGVYAGPSHVNPQFQPGHQSPFSPQPGPSHAQAPMYYQQPGPSHGQEPLYFHQPGPSPSQHAVAFHQSSPPAQAGYLKRPSAQPEVSTMRTRSSSRKVNVCLPNVEATKSALPLRLPSRCLNDVSIPLDSKFACVTCKYWSGRYILIPCYHYAFCITCLEINFTETNGKAFCCFCKTPIESYAEGIRCGI